MTDRLAWLLVSFLGAMPAAAACTQVVPTVEITIVMKFAEAAHRVGWIYKTLSPRLRVGNGKPHVPTMAIVDQSLQSVFCIPAARLEGVDAVVFAYGPRELKLAKRPATNGAWPKITLPQEKSPDWTIVEKAEWLVGGDGKPRIDVHVHNFSAATHPGFDLTLAFSNVRGSCYSPSPQAVTVPLVIGFLKGMPTVKSADVSFPKDPLKRDAKFEWGHCGNVIFKTVVGSTGPLEGSSATLIRYLFPEPLLEVPVEVPKEGEKKLTVAHIYALKERSVQVSGERVYPQIIWVR